MLYFIYCNTASALSESLTCNGNTRSRCYVIITVLCYHLHINNTIDALLIRSNWGWAPVSRNPNIRTAKSSVKFRVAQKPWRDTGYGVLRPTRHQVRAWRTSSSRSDGAALPRYVARAFARKTEHRIKSIVIVPPAPLLQDIANFYGGPGPRCDKALYDQGSRLLSRLRLTKPAFYAAINLSPCCWSTLASSLF